MITLRGKFNEALIYTDNVEEKAMAQIIELCNQEFCKDSKIRIMPDTHAGSGCTIGTTMTIKDKIVPNLVGVDIGCGMEVVILNNKEVDFSKLDCIIREYIPHGFDIRKEAHKFVDQVRLKDLKCLKHINQQRSESSIGTLGGGNHFIEIATNDLGYLFLVIHSGSRNLGKQVAEYYQNLAIKSVFSLAKGKEKLIKILKNEGREKDIQKELSKLNKPKISKDLAYLEGDEFNDYLHDMKIVQEYADINRKAMAEEIISRMGFEIKNRFSTIHNYIDTDEMILRKGAVSAKAGETFIVPINMRDGSLICKGSGNPDWNYSAPHGAGRLMSRSQAKEKIKIEDFKESMKDVWTTSVNNNTLDESPMAYKPVEEIMINILDTATIVDVIKPLYNFKSN